MPQSPDALPPAKYEWRRESDEERKLRLERAGVTDARPGAAASAAASGTQSAPSAGIRAVENLKQQVAANKERAKKSYLLWWTADAAHWRSVRTPRDTKTIPDASWSVGFELTHPEWIVGGLQLGIGPKALFFNGGQYARLSDSIFTGNGYANFSASEVGLAASFTSPTAHLQSPAQWYWAGSVVYAPLRLVSARRTSSDSMIPRSDTDSRTAINLPGLGLQAGVGVDWNSLARIEAFASLHGAWPPQIRARFGLQMSVGMTLDTPSQVTR